MSARRIHDLGNAPGEHEITAHLAGLRNEVGGWHSWHVNNSAPQVRPRSSLWHDDLVTAPFQCSHLILHYLNVASDCLHALFSSAVIDASDGIGLVTHPHGQVPLIRAAFEAGCHAMYLLGGETTRVRVKARLFLRLEDLHRHAVSQKEAIRDFGGRGISTPQTSGQVDQQRDDAIRELHGVAAPLGIRRDELKFGQRPMTGNIVEKAGVYSGEGAHRFLFIWNVLAGASHGAFWANRDLLTYEIVDEHEDGELVTVNTTLSPLAFAFMTDESVNITRLAWERWKVRADSA